MGILNFGGVFDKFSFEDVFADYTDAVNARGRALSSGRSSVRGPDQNRSLGGNDEGESALDRQIRQDQAFTARKNLRAVNSISAHGTNVNNGDYVLNVQGFAPGTVPYARSESTRTERNPFSKPIGIYGKDTKATMTFVEANNTGSYTQEFVITNVQEEHNERYQLLDTFGGWDLILFGQDPVFVTCGGFLYNGAHISSNWANRFRNLYRDKFGGNKATYDDRRVFIYYDGRQLEGVILKLRLNQTADVDKIVNFNMTMILVADREILQPGEL